MPEEEFQKLSEEEQNAGDPIPPEESVDAGWILREYRTS
jgi:hypothetical protein